MLLFMVVATNCLTHSLTDAQMLAPQYGPAEQLVVLTNGDFLRGRVSRNVEQVIVHAAQSRLVLPADRIEFICNSLDEAYWEKVARLKATDIPGQVNLFQWCLKNQLLGHAQNQIVILLELGTKATELENLDRQLNVALMQERAAENRLANQSERTNQSTIEGAAQSRIATQDRSQVTSHGLRPIEMSAAIGDQNLIGQTDKVSDVFDPTRFRSLPSFDEKTSPHASVNSQFATLPPFSANPDDETIDKAAAEPIRQVGFDEDVYETISPTDRLPSAASLKADLADHSNPLDQVDDRVMTAIPELERELRALPKGSTGFYRARVEGALAFGCNAAKCHDSNSRIMPILQMNSSQAITRMQSQRNLHNVLKYVDRANPFESRLFLAATQPHAGREKPILILNRSENLKKWLIMIADDPNSALQDAVRLEQEGQSLDVRVAEREASQDRNAAVNATGQSEPNMPTGIVPVKPKRVGLAPLGDSSLQFPATVGEIPKLNGREKTFVPIDPFDPEIFNRRSR